MRYSNQDAAIDKGVSLDRDDIPLWTYHIKRLQEAHTHFVKRDHDGDGGNQWGEWLGEQAIWDQVRMKLENTPKGDWRVCSPVPNDMILSREGS